jgi:hypothetical protein
LDVVTNKEVARTTERVSTMDAVELRIEIECDLEILFVGRGFGGENFEEHQPEYVMETINDRLQKISWRRRE